MTGREALAEAARLEAARVYGAVVHEHKQPAGTAALVAEAELADRDVKRAAHDLEVARRRRIARGAA